MRAVFLCLTASVSFMCNTAFAEEPPAAAPLKPEELQQLVAPIALYPDDLLSQVLIASTYPLEVVEADRWVKANSKLDPEKHKAELQNHKWDSSVKSLTTTPEVLANMSNKLDWTQKLGDAMLAQQTDVMDAVQALRSKAMANDTLKSTPQQTVETQKVENKEVIIIQPAQQNTVYVSYYDPNTTYGTWAYPSYPPAYYPPPPYYPMGGALMSGLMFGAGIAIMDDIWDDDDVDWGSGDINIDNSVNIDRGNNINRGDRVDHRRQNGGGKWKHDPSHRGGVPYRNAGVQKKFNQGRNPAAATRDFRGTEGRQVLEPSAGNRSATRPTQPTSRADMNRTRPQMDNGMGRRNNNAFAGIDNGQTTRAQSARGRSSLGSNRSSGSRASSSGRRSGGGGGSRGGGGGGGGGGRRR
jgi:uncharacterized membrane protein YgcG